MPVKALKPKSKYASTTEAQYAYVLQQMQIAGEIRDYAYSPIKLILADNTTYTPDFFVVTNDNTIEFHEVKGFWRDDARVKLKVAAALFPWFVFLVIKKDKKNFIIDERFNDA